MNFGITQFTTVILCILYSYFGITQFVTVILCILYLYIINLMVGLKRKEGSNTLESGSPTDYVVWVGEPAVSYTHLTLPPILLV